LSDTSHEIVCDVLVAGSGASGLSAAVTSAFHGLDVIVCEREPVFGGTTAWSGGWLWIPGNPLARRAGIAEDADEAKTYLESTLGKAAKDPRIVAFLEAGPEMVSFFEQQGFVAWIDGNHIPDFHDVPGARNGGRSVSVAAFDARLLGKLAKTIRPPLDVVSLFGMGLNGQDLGHFFRAPRSLPSALYATRRLGRHSLDLFRNRRGQRLVNGNALIAMLLGSADALGVQLWTNAPVVELKCGSGSVCGAVVKRGGDLVDVTARKGVVLATGGFPHDHARIADLFKPALSGQQHYSAAPETNLGDGVRLAEAAGAAFDTALEHTAAWCPVSRVPLPYGGYRNFPHLVDRAKPGIIAVTANGRRFTNEADSYHDFMSAWFDLGKNGDISRCWLIGDHRAQRRYGLGWSKPFPFPLRTYQKSDYLMSAPTLETLARKTGISESGLTKTIVAFNASAITGEDPEFGRGRSPYNRIQGDAEHYPNPSLGTLEEGPFHAVELFPGSLGTFAGLKTDANARVLDNKGIPISGLFSVGNDMSSIFGGHYPSGGITLGPGMTFGYLAGRTLAGAGSEKTTS